MADCQQRDVGRALPLLSDDDGGDDDDDDDDDDDGGGGDDMLTRCFVMNSSRLSYTCVG
jgi:hypothetical protein